ncbi:AAA family ATPase [Clostridium formicaceticum]|uniref:Bacterial transcriptional activator domain protein n=1 Tax=Clostridium formicaceticum TaxID=1497 RepID=A0AAC9RL83_9CLOT|nr:AAA family ATPase [Clostridium formicaceticum]AOY74774.1 hypothetical protein BJL90_01665 [Clostridium formicaceticum]ARE89164.1 Bacterial transcriptional activator domain protein [Clostridium formicaceticum]
MDCIYLQLFNTPAIFKNNTRIFLPFKKAEALFYYLVVHQRATREELVHLLWGEIDEETAKKNLRNAMYKIRKAFDLNIVISPQRAIVMINPDIKIESDLEIFITGRDKGIGVYTGEFLQGFHVRDGGAFENWMSTTREYYREMYIARLQEKLHRFLDKKDEKMVEYYAKLLIQVDPFDEKTYRILMRLYSDQGAYSKAIDLYSRLQQVLQQELGITPDRRTKELLKDIFPNRGDKETKNKEKPQEFFYGRKKEVKRLENNYRSFIKEGCYSSCFIVGEAGIGKTTLKNQLLKIVAKEELYLLETNCYQAEEKYFLKPWNAIFSLLSEKILKDNIELPPLWKDILISVFPGFATEGTASTINFLEEGSLFNYRVVEDAVLGLFKRISSRRKIIVVFEDLQWIDSMSLSLLSSLLQQDQGKNLLFVGTCRDGYDKRIDKFMVKIRKYHPMEEIPIGRFTFQEVGDFIHKTLPDLSMKGNLVEEIYEETEGNTFFIIEYLQSLRKNNDFEKITPKMQDILKSRFLEVSEEGKKVLNIISLFFDKVSLELLTTLMNKDELQVMQMIEELQNKNIVKALEKGHEITFQFTHLKLREFIYFQQSSAMRKVLHNKVGNILESQLRHNKVDVLNYSRLIYHFSHAGNQFKTLKYSIKNINAHLDFSYEVFPTSNEVNEQKKEGFFGTEKELLQSLKAMEEELEEIKKYHFSWEEMVKLQIEFLYIRGRYAIREGAYKEAIVYIQQMIEASKTIKAHAYCLKGYKQMIYYCIQAHKVEEMTFYVEEALLLARTCREQKEIGIALRLKGLNKIMMGRYVEAEEVLKASIKIFDEITKIDNKYIINIAAAYNYMGEIRRYTMKFSSALNYYDKAIAICEENKVLKGLTQFNTNAGQAALEMGDYQRAKEYLQRAISLYQQIEVFWGRSIAEGYMALLLVSEGRYKEALAYLKTAEVYAEKLKSPYELGILYRVKTEIKAKFGKNSTLKEIFDDYLSLNIEEYCKRGIALLGEVKTSYEKEILKVFIKDAK